MTKLNLLTSVAITAASLSLGANTALAADDIVSAAPTDSTVVYWGAEAGQDATTLYAGVVHALNGDLDSDGILARISGAFGDYSYNTVAVAGGVVDIEAKSADIMIGYQVVQPTHVAAIYVGADYRDNELTPSDPNNSTEGGEAGFKVQAEASTRGDGPGMASILASYSTAYETYFVKGRLGVRNDGLAFGPELAVLGDEEFDGYKAGVFLSGLQLGDIGMTLYGGYESSEGKDGGREQNGAYGGVSFGIRF